jgi:hypothetical protein
MRKAPLVFCLLRNPQPLLPKIWKLHPSNTEQHWQLLDSRNERQLPDTMDYSNKTFCSFCDLKGRSCLSPVYATYHGLVPRTLTNTQVQIRWKSLWSMGNLDTMFAHTRWSVVTRQYKKRGPARLYPHTVEYGIEVLLLAMCGACVSHPAISTCFMYD